MTNFQCEITLRILCVHGHDDATQKTALLQQGTDVRSSSHRAVMQDVDSHLTQTR